MEHVPPQKLTLSNNTDGVLEVYVEINPDRYLLQPKDELLIEAPPAPPGREAFSVNVYPGSVQIYPNFGFATGVWINNVPAKPINT